MSAYDYDEDDYEDDEDFEDRLEDDHDDGDHAGRPHADCPACSQATGADDSFTGLPREALLEDAALRYKITAGAGQALDEYLGGPW